MSIRFDWDAANLEHIARHGVTAAQVEQVFANVPKERRRETRNGEERFVFEGTDNGGKRFSVVEMWRAGALRVVTSYPVHRGEGRKT